MTTNGSGRSEAHESRVRGSERAAGPLVISKTNPRYFMVSAGDVAHRNVVYLTGSHINNNFTTAWGSARVALKDPNSLITMRTSHS
jgi:hypothetical protein